MANAINNTIGGTLVSTASTVNLLDTGATTINFGGVATNIDIGATTGTTKINNTVALMGIKSITSGFDTATTIAAGGSLWSFTVNTDPILRVSTVFNNGVSPIASYIEAFTNSDVADSAAVLTFATPNYSTAYLYGIINGDHSGTCRLTVFNAAQTEIPVQESTATRNSWLVASGYGAATAGSVTQATSKSTAVTLNTTNGSITMNNALLAAAASATFTLTNSTIEAGDYIGLNIISGATGVYVVNAAAGSGSCTITITNLSLVGLTDALVLKFMVFKGGV